MWPSYGHPGAILRQGERGTSRWATKPKNLCNLLGWDRPLRITFGQLGERVFEQAERMWTVERSEGPQIHRVWYSLWPGDNS
jgi:hypothetical protein